MVVRGIRSRSGELVAMAAGQARGSARLAVAGEDGGAQRCGRHAEGRQDHRDHAVLHGEQGQGEALHDNYIGVQHLTLALLALKDGTVPVILSALGAPAAPLRAAILARYRKAS